MIIIKEIRDILGDISQRPGAAFYSHASTLVPGDYLIVGLNPGRDPRCINSTIEMSFEDFQVEGYNAYFQEWTSNGRIHRLQMNIQKLFEYLNYDLRKVAATNLFYERTINEKEIDQSHRGKYREVLMKVLDVVMPKSIFCFGIEPYKSILSIIHTEKSNYREESAKHGSWKVRLLSGSYKGQGLKVVGLPHLSRYTLYNRKDVMKIIKDFTANS